MSQIITRFAPSPTGYLHLGHAYSALFAQSQAKGGRFLLRIEDIDTTRCRPEYIDAIYEDLAWLGLKWELPVRLQSQHFDHYQAQLKKLNDLGVLYACTCTRSDIAQEINNAGNAPHGPDGPLYPGICRHKPWPEADTPHALRLDVKKAMALTGPIYWHDVVRGRQVATPEIFGDVVLARKDTPTSYHLSVVCDDALQGVTLVTRGEDLFEATHIHVLIQRLLGLPTPDYFHHRLQYDADGRRYSKRDKSLTLRDLRENGASPTTIREMLDLS